MSPSFYLLVSARFLLTFAVQMQAVLLGWQMYELTRDPLQLGLIGLAEAIPALSLALFAGYITDRNNPKSLYQTVTAISFISVLVSLFAKNPDQLYVAAVITGIARSFSGPSLQSLIPRIVPRHLLSIASAWTTSAMKLASISGPALAGILIAWVGLKFSYSVSAFALGLGFISIFFVKYDHVKKEEKDHQSIGFIPELLVGLRFVLGNRILLSALTLDMFAVLFGGVNAILPVYAVEILNVGPSGLGFLRASSAAGAFITTVWLIRNPVSKKAGILLLRVVAGFGLCILTFALSKNLWISCFALASSGALDSVSMVIRSAIVQLYSPDEMRGRIGAVNAIFIGSSNELGAFESGLAAKLFGTVPSVVFGGVMTLVTVTLVMWMAPEIKKLDLDQLE